MNLTEAQQLAIDLINEEKNVFITGSAGVGKSFLIQEIVKNFRNQERYFEVLAFTGVAAVNIGGNTIHRMFGLKPTTQNIEDYQKQNCEMKSKISWDKIKHDKRATFIIDEVSMLHGNTFSLIRQILGFHTDHNKEIKFQFVIVADMYQLGPIPNKDDTKETALYAFETRTWKDMNLHTVFLTEVMRQKDEEFISVLNKIRVGNFTKECEEMMQVATENKMIPDKHYVRLFCRNIDKNAANTVHLAAIKSESHFYNSIDSGNTNLLKNVLADESIELKVGAKVMLLVNKPEYSLFNGSVGAVTYFRNETYICGTDWLGKPEFKTEVCPVVLFNNGQEIAVGRNLWEIEERNKHGNFFVAARRLQIPLTLAWAISIHKSQSLQFQYVVCDFDGMFGNGLVYVALSRAISPDGLIVKNFLKKYVKKNKKVDGFYKSLEI